MAPFLKYEGFRVLQVPKGSYIQPIVTYTFKKKRTRFQSHRIHKMDIIYRLDHIKISHLYSAGPRIFDSLMADLFCVRSFSIYRLVSTYCEQLVHCKHTS
jgi:hypothetical protein